MESVKAPSEPVAAPPKPRVQVIDRRQMVLRPIEVERWIEPDHPARAIWELVGQRDLSGFYAPIKAVEGTAGREPVDPHLLISLWIYAYSQKIGSAREIERRCRQFDPGFGWLTGLTVINHHTLSDFRTGHGPALEQLFIELLAVLSQAEVVSLDLVMQDGMKVKANAADNSFRREPSLRQHLEAAQQQIQQLEQEAQQELEGKGQNRRQQQAQRRAVRERQERIEQALAELEQIRAVGKDGKDRAQKQAEARASLTDPEARIMKQAQGAIGPAYNLQISTDAKEKIIVAQAVSQSSADTGELAPAAERVEANTGRKPQKMVADKGFTNQAAVEAMQQSGIELIGSLADHSAQSEGRLRQRGIAPEFFPSAFRYQAEANHYVCPQGKVLRFEGREKKAGGGLRYRYRAAAADCQACPLRVRCCPESQRGRSLVRTEDAPVMAAFKAKMETEAAQQIYKQRAGVAEFPNAWIKDKLGLRQFRLRGRVKVGLEALWACLTYTVQQWIRLLWRPQRQAAPVAT
jgi:transposase